MPRLMRARNLVGLNYFEKDKNGKKVGSYLGLCPEYWTNSLIKELIDLECPPNYICAMCDLGDTERDNCAYHAQFKTEANLVLAPVQFMGTKAISVYDPDVITLDDSANLTHVLPPLPKIEEWLDYLKARARTCNNLILTIT